MTRGWAHRGLRPRASGLRGPVAAFLALGLLGVAIPTPGRASQALVEDTGQTTCWDATGAVTTCGTGIGVGQDGDVQAGVDWPTPRFTDNGDGTVTDNLTNLVWLKNAKCFESRTWAEALSDANGLASGSCGLTDGTAAGDWRLPNITELLSLVDYARSSPALPAGHPFTNIGPSEAQATHVSSSSRVQFPERARYVNTFRGSAPGGPKTVAAYEVWPVRDRLTAISVGGAVESTSGGLRFPDGTVQLTAATGGDGSQALVERTGQEACWDAAGAVTVCGAGIGLGQDGDLETGVEWPTPRFTDNGDGTVTDNLTTLVWLKDVDCLTITTWAGALADSKALSAGDCGLSDGSSAGDWRLPNVKELTSLLDYGQGGPTLPFGHPFSLPVGPGPEIWSSSSGVPSGTFAWVVSMRFAEVKVDAKSNNSHLWPVRGGV